MNKTRSQENAYHLWFRQIAETCQENGITLPMIMKASEKGIEMEVTPEIVKEIWRFAQKKMFGKSSTTELSKQGEIDRLIDVFVLFFSKMEVELPPFPSNEIEIDA